MKSLGVIHSTYFNSEQFLYSFQNFKKHFPNSPYLIYSDMGDNFSEFEDENTFYKRSNIRFYGTGPKASWSDNWDLWLSYYGRLKEACEICKTDYILLMEDDVLVTENFKITKDFNFCGPCKQKLSNYIVDYIEKKINKNINPFYGLCGGAIFNSKIFLENYDKIIENLKTLHYEYSNNLTEEIATCGDGNFTIQFNLLGFEYTCSEYFNKNIIIHPYPNYKRFIP